MAYERSNKPVYNTAV